MSYANCQIKDIQIMMHMSVSKTQFNSIHYKAKLTFLQLLHIILCLTKSTTPEKLQQKNIRRITQSKYAV